MIRLTGDLHRKVAELAAREERAVAQWCARAVRAEVERIEAERERSDR